jgi:hypothetical protein
MGARWTVLSRIGAWLILIGLSGSAVKHHPAVLVPELAKLFCLVLLSIPDNQQKFLWGALISVLGDVIILSMR